MSPIALASASALALSLAGLPDHAALRYRVELAGAPIGWASLSVTCAAESCQAEWRSVLRAPEGTDGALLEKRIRMTTDRDGRGRTIAVSAPGDARARAVPPGERVPASLAELLLSEARDGERLCLDVIDEESGRAGRACAVRNGDRVSEELMGVKVELTSPEHRPAPGLPTQVFVPEQGIRYQADPAAEVPSRPPKLFGIQVAVAPGSGSRAPAQLCGVAAEQTGPGGLVPAIPETLQGNCREQAAAYLGLARRQGFTARNAVGVAWDGAALVWHAWVEVWADGHWIAVDPAFRQAPAEGPRFTVARFTDGDGPARRAAGVRVLQCWGHEQRSGVGQSATR
jgi:hypothetical protein